MEDKPAFPITAWAENMNGMTLRQYYAGQVLGSLTSDDGFKNEDAAVAWCFRMADAMIAYEERERNNEKQTSGA